MQDKRSTSSVSLSSLSASPSKDSKEEPSTKEDSCAVVTPLKSSSSPRRYTFSNDPILLAKGYTEPRPIDVWCGRGRGCWSHVGNQQFQNVVQSSLTKYRNTQLKRDKTNIVASIVDTLRKQGTLFVKFDTDKRRWYDIGDRQARDKTSHCIRDHLASKDTHSTASTSRPSTPCEVDSVITPSTTNTPSRSSSVCHVVEEQDDKEEPPLEVYSPHLPSTPRTNEEHRERKRGRSYDDYDGHHHYYHHSYDNNYYYDQENPQDYYSPPPPPKKQRSHYTSITPTPSEYSPRRVSYRSAPPSEYHYDDWYNYNSERRYGREHRQHRPSRHDYHYHEEEEEGIPWSELFPLDFRIEHR